MTVLLVTNQMPTIESADNILYIKNESTVLSVSKDTEAYEDVMNQLKSTRIVP